MRFASFAAILCCVAVAPTAGAMEFRSAAAHFRVQIPDGWARFPPARLDLARNMGDRRANNILQEGFEPANDPFDPDGMPQILIQESRDRPHNLTTHADIERVLNQEYRQNLEAAGNRPIGPIKLDRAKNRFIALTEITLPNGGKGRGVHYGFLGKDGWVVITCYTHDADFEQRKPAFDAMADSFAFDEGFEFETFKFERFAWIAAAAAGGLACLLIAAVGIGFVLLMWLARK